MQGTPEQELKCAFKTTVTLIVNTYTSIQIKSPLFYARLQHKLRADKRNLNSLFYE